MFSGDDNIIIFELSDFDDLAQSGWGDITRGDLAAFERCGFIQPARYDTYGYVSEYFVDLYTVAQAVDNDLELPEIQPFAPVNIEAMTVTGMVNINSTLRDTSQIIGTAPSLEYDFKQELQDLIQNLQDGLVDVPPEDAEVIAEQIHILAQQINRENPNKKGVAITAAGLQKAAENVANIAPPVFVAAVKIADALRKAGLG